MHLDAVLEHLPQLHHELSRSLVAGHVRPIDEEAEIPGRQVVASFYCSFGPVPPLGCLDTSDQRLGDSKDALRTGLRTSFLASLLPLEEKGSADLGDAASEKLLGDRALLGGQGLEQGIAMAVADDEATLASGRRAPGPLSVGIGPPALACTLGAALSTVTVRRRVRLGAPSAAWCSRRTLRATRAYTTGPTSGPWWPATSVRARAPLTIGALSPGAALGAVGSRWAVSRPATLASLPSARAGRELRRYSRVDRSLEQLDPVGVTGLRSPRRLH